VPGPIPDPSYEAAHAGFFAHALELFSAGWAYLRARIELASLEGKDAVGHWLKALGLLLAGLVVFVFGYFFLWLGLIFALAMAFGGGNAWIWVTLAVALLHFALGVVLLLRVKTLAQAPVLPITLEEFKKDQAWLDAKTAKKS